MSIVYRYIFTIRVSLPWLKDLSTTSLEGSAVLIYTKLRKEDILIFVFFASFLVKIHLEPKKQLNRYITKGLWLLRH